MTNIVGSEGLTITQHSRIKVQVGSSASAALCSHPLIWLPTPAAMPRQSSSPQIQTEYRASLIPLIVFSKQNPARHANVVLHTLNNANFPPSSPARFQFPARRSQPRTATAAPPTSGSPLPAHYSTREGVGLSSYHLGTVPVQKSHQTCVKKAKAR